MQWIEINNHPCLRNGWIEDYGILDYQKPNKRASETPRSLSRTLKTWRLANKG